MSSTPSLGLLDSLRFVYDAPTFLAAGRRLGPVWRFWFAGTGQRLTVISDPLLAELALTTPGLEFYRGEALEPWLGKLAPLLTSGPAHNAGRAQALKVLRRRRAPVDPRPLIHAALQRSSNAGEARTTYPRCRAVAATMNQREAKRMVCEAAAATLGFPEENDWIFGLRDGSPRPAKDIERLVLAWTALVSELATRAGTTEHT